MRPVEFTPRVYRLSFAPLSSFVQIDVADSGMGPNDRPRSTATHVTWYGSVNRSCYNLRDSHEAPPQYTNCSGSRVVWGSLLEVRIAVQAKPIGENFQLLKRLPYCSGAFEHWKGPVRSHPSLPIKFFKSKCKCVVSSQRDSHLIVTWARARG